MAVNSTSRSFARQPPVLAPRCSSPSPTSRSATSIPSPTGSSAPPRSDIPSLRCRVPRLTAISSRGRASSSREQPARRRRTSHRWPLARRSSAIRRGGRSCPTGRRSRRCRRYLPGRRRGSRCRPPPSRRGSTCRLLHLQNLSGVGQLDLETRGDGVRVGLERRAPFGPQRAGRQGRARGLQGVEERRRSAAVDQPHRPQRSAPGRGVRPRPAGGRRPGRRSSPQGRPRRPSSPGCDHRSRAADRCRQHRPWRASGGSA